MAIKGTGILALLALVASLGVLAGPAAATPTTSNSAATLRALQSGVLDQLNAIRTQHGLVPLKASARLTASSVQHTREMGADGYFEHNSNDGTVFWKRIDHWYSAAGFGYWSVGENMLWSSPGVDPTEAMNLWMASPEHRANILNAHWREIGIAAVHFAAAPGAYKGLEVTIITTDFGARH